MLKKLSKKANKISHVCHLTPKEVKAFTRDPDPKHRTKYDFRPFDFVGREIPSPLKGYLRNLAPKDIKKAIAKADLAFLERDPTVNRFSAKTHAAKLPMRAKETSLFSQAFIPDHIGISPLPHIVKIPTTRFPRTERLRHMHLQASRLTYPWTTIGKLTVTGEYDLSMWGMGLVQISSSGTATVIGRHRVVTASHVLPFGSRRYWGTFTPSLSVVAPQAPFGSFTVNGFWGMSNSSSDVCGWECSVVSLAEPVGDVTGWMGVYGTTDDDFFYDGSFYSGGYPGTYYNGQEMSVETNIKVNDTDNDSNNSLEVEIDWFTNSGWSGGPLFTWLDSRTPGITVPGPYVCGTLSGREKDGLDPRRTVFSAGSPLIRVVRESKSVFGD